MAKNRQNPKELLAGLSAYPLPENFEQRILFAVHEEQRRSEQLRYGIWAFSFLSSIIATITGFAWSLQSISTDGTIELIKIAISNIQLLNLSDVFWGIVENLPLNGLALIFCALTVLGILASAKKSSNQHILSLQHI